MKNEPAQATLGSKRAFLQDVLICSLGAYGGPEAHVSIFIDQLVSKKHYLTETQLIELVALCSILPGPTSTQTIVAVGYKTGGPSLALLTFLVWALPVLCVMTALSFLYMSVEQWHTQNDVLRYIGPMAVGFIVTAAFRIGKKVITNRLTAVLLVFGALTTLFLRDAWVFPAMLLIGGAVTTLTSGKKNLWNKVLLRPPWVFLILLIGFALLGLVLSKATDQRLIVLFENFYRYGYLVFGGGQVVVPVMYSELVEVRNWLTHTEFLTGYGLVQGLPGPMFSFSAFAGGLSARQAGTWVQLAAAAISGIGIFLPGILLIYFVYPIWENLKKIQGIRISIQGINAVAGGLIVAAAIVLMLQSGFALDALIVTGLTIVLLATKKIPAPLIVVAVLLTGLL